MRVIVAVYQACIMLEPQAIYCIDEPCRFAAGNDRVTERLAEVECPFQVPSRAPLALATIKGFTGHQEAASGVANLLAAALTAGRACMPAAVNLRALNPLVAGALAGQPTRIARGGSASMPTTHAGRTGSLQMGINAFGAQGTNAHAIIMSGPQSAIIQNDGPSAQGLLQKKRHWVVPVMQV